MVEIAFFFFFGERMLLVYFIKIIGSSGTAQWQHMNQVLKHALFKKTFASQKLVSYVLYA